MPAKVNVPKRGRPRKGEPAKPHHGHHVSDRHRNHNFAFATGVALNIAFVAIEATYGILADSLALISDAGHNLSDVVSLLLAWGASLLGRRKATNKRTYGYKRVSILASLISATLLIFALGGITWEAIVRLKEPAPVQGITVITVAGVGTVINSLTALLFVSGQKHDLNLRSAYLHMIADAGVSVGVVLSGIVILYTGLTWIDPVTSLMIVAVILSASWSLLRESLNLSIDAVPSTIKLNEVRDFLHSLPGVKTVHDLHVWAMSTTETAMTVHLVVHTPLLDNRFLHSVSSSLHARFGIEHCTIQLEMENPISLAGKDNGCVNHPDPTNACG
ncbi:MAG: cation diffusion facilitator family transporter [Pseudomonadota bacterium]